MIPLPGLSVKRQSGFSLIELMIASVIGLILLAGLSLLFVNSSETNRELQKTAQQIENGRYAIDILTQNIHLAGFYGHLHDLTAIAAPGTTPPDPCESSDAAKLLSALWFPIQGYSGTIHATTPASDTRPDVSSTSCGALTAANLQPGSDVVVIRRANTNALTATDTTVANAFYIQASATAAEIQTGSGNALGSCPSAAEHCKANGVTPSTLRLTNGQVPAPAAPVRRYHVHVYFVAPCSVGSGTAGGVSGVCTASDDTIPTLKRLELSASGSFTIVPLVEGIELLKVQYGVDTSPTTANITTGHIGDSSVDSYTTAPADWRTVVGARVSVLARNTEATQGHTDDKTYLLGAIAVPARNDRFKRHVFSTTVRLTNPAGRREIPTL